MGRGCEMDIAKAAFAAARGEQAHARRRQIDLIFLALDRHPRDRTRRHAHDQILAIAAVLTRAAAIAATAGLKFALIAKRQQRIEMLIGQQVDMPATATIATIGATARHMRLTPKSSRTIAAITGLNRDLRPIKKF